MKKVLVTQNIMHNKYHLACDSLEQDFIEFLFKSGLSPFPVPNSPHWNEESLVQLFENVNPSGIVLSGGNNIGDFPIRDKLENLLISFAINNNLPVVGVCRGAQIIATYFGAMLVSNSGKHAGKTHRIKRLESVVFHRFIKSHHNYAITSISKNLSATFLAEDDSIEGIEHNELPIKGIMWHPERQSEIHIDDLNYFKNYF
jgi:putative glutamine amidotransferase